MIEFAFVRNHVGGGPLVVLTLSLAVFAVHVPALVGFTVARYYDPEAELLKRPLVLTATFSDRGLQRRRPNFISLESRQDARSSAG